MGFTEVHKDQQLNFERSNSKKYNACPNDKNLGDSCDWK